MKPIVSGAQQRVLTPSTALAPQAPSRGDLRTGVGIYPDGSRFERVRSSVVPQKVPAALEGDRDPMTHIAHLASDEMRGRNSPSPELDRAAAHIAAYVEKYGLKPMNGDSFLQSFAMYNLAGVAPENPGVAPEGLTTKPFEDAISYENLSSEDWKIIRQRLLERGVSSERIGSGMVPPHDLFTKSGEISNVVARLEGTGPHKDEVIVVMAHYDHVGARWGKIYNGADDNASGTATVMSVIPELVAAQKRGELDRSIVFIWTAAEEKGLVGASHYVRNPLPGAGLDEIEGVINVDMVGRWDDERVSYSARTNRAPNYLAALTEQANASLPDPFDNVNQDINRYERAQDGYMFSRAGEDAIFLFEGMSRATGGGSLNPDYHRPGDTTEKMLAENNGDKVRKMRDLLEKLVVAASKAGGKAAATTSVVPD